MDFMNWYRGTDYESINHDQLWPDRFSFGSTPKDSNFSIRLCSYVAIVDPVLVFRELRCYTILSYLFTQELQGPRVYV